MVRGWVSGRKVHARRRGRADLIGERYNQCGGWIVCQHRRPVVRVGHHISETRDAVKRFQNAFKNHSESASQLRAITHTDYEESRTIALVRDILSVLGRLTGLNTVAHDWLDSHRSRCDAPARAGARVSRGDRAGAGVRRDVARANSLLSALIACYGNGGSRERHGFAHEAGAARLSLRYGEQPRICACDGAGAVLRMQISAA